LITKLAQLINVCILSIQQQERAVAPVPISAAEPVEPKTSECSLKIAAYSGKVIAFVGAITVFKALYTGFHAQSIANKALNITEGAEFVTRDQFALSDNLKVISFLTLPIGFILMSFYMAAKRLNGNCMRKCYWKFQCAKFVIIAILVHAIKGFKVENNKMLEKEHSHCKFVMVLVFIMLAHIFFARKVGKQAAAVKK